MDTHSNQSKKLNIRGLTTKQESFCKLVALEDMPVTEAVQRVYRGQQHADLSELSVRAE